MKPLPYPFRASLRVAEALALSALAGAFTWTLVQVVRVPLLSSALLGFLAGGTVTMRTLGVQVRSRRRRMAFAVTCALLAVVTARWLEYRTFLHHERDRANALDYTLSPAQTDARLQSELAELTGHRGPLGYALSALIAGRRIGPLTLRGAALAVYELAELAVAIGVAACWAGGPAPRPVTQQAAGPEGAA